MKCETCQLIKNQQTPGHVSFVIDLQGYILNSRTEQNSIQKGVAQFIGNANNIGCLLRALSCIGSFDT